MTKNPLALAAIVWTVLSFVVAPVTRAGASGANDGKPKKQKDKLSDAERGELVELIKLVDAAAAGQAPITESRGVWEKHVLKATEGMGYIPLTMTFSSRPDTFHAVAMYVRVVSRRPDGRQAAERSGLKQWLLEEAARGVARPPAIRGFMPVNPDEMPTGGPAAGSRRTVTNTAQGSSVMLALLEKENMGGHTGQDSEDEKTEKKREAETFLHPFEDFDFLDLPAGGADALHRVVRAVAVPTGEYDVYLALRERQAPGKRQPAPRTLVCRQPLSVPDLSKGLAMSSVILADRLDTLTVPYKPEQQTAHPYALGWTEISPAVDSQFSDLEQMGVVFQVLNPLPDPRRKPDVTVEYNFHRKTPSGETLLTSARQDFNRTTLPAEFDIAAGHQLFTAQPVPLKAFPPGDYRLELRVTDRRAGKTVTNDVGFTVIASQNSLWVGRTVASLVAPAFRREDLLRSDVLGVALDRLVDVGDRSRSPGFNGAIEHAQAGRYANLLSSLPGIEPDALAASFLRGVALLGLNGNLEAAAGQFRDALRLAPSFHPAALYLGGCLAASGRDKDAIAVWQNAAKPPSTPGLPVLLAEAFLRVDEAPRAVQTLNDASGRWPDDDRVKKRLAAARMATHDDAAALEVLEPYLARHAHDVDALFLAMYLLQHSRVAGRPLDASAQAEERLIRYAAAYVEAHGPHQAVVSQWLRGG